MARRFERLTLDHLPELADPTCTSCVHWQLGPVSRNLPNLHGAEEKSAWVSTVLREWGHCGSVALVDNVIVGHAIWAPVTFVPGAASYASGPVSPDAVLLTTVYVHPEHRRSGIGRNLVRVMAKELLHRRDVRAVEAFATTKGEACMIDRDFLLAVGFSTHRPHPLHPRMRMDLRTTLSIREELEQVLDRLLRPLPGRPATERSPLTRGAGSAPEARP